MKFYRGGPSAYIVSALTPLLLSVLIQEAIGQDPAGAGAPGGSPAAAPGGPLGQPPGGMPESLGAATGKAPAKAHSRPKPGSEQAVLKAIDIKNARELGAQRYALAASKLNNVIKRDPDYANAYRAFGWLLIAQSKRDAARAQFQKALDLMKPDENEYNEVNEALQRLGPAPAPPESEPGKAGADTQGPGKPGKAAGKGKSAPPSAAPEGGGPSPDGTAPGGPAPGGPTPGGPAPGGPADVGVPPPAAPTAGGSPAAPGKSGMPGTPPGVAGAVPPPPAESSGGGLTDMLPFVGVGLAVVLLLAVGVKKFVLDKKSAAV